MPKINKGWFKPGHKLNVESDNPIWKGDKVGYIALHEWVRTHLPKPGSALTVRQARLVI